MSLVETIKKILEFEVGNTNKAKNENENSSKKKNKVNRTNNVQVIRVLSNVPKYRHIISLPEGYKVPNTELDHTHSSIITFNEDLKNNYIILDISKDKPGEEEIEKRALILSAVELNDPTKLDNKYLSVRRRCVEAGYKVSKKCFASKEIIALLYDKNIVKTTSDEEETNKADIIEKFDEMLSESVVENVSDMHIEVGDNGAKVKYRKNGILELTDTWSKEYALKVSQVIYDVLADEKEVVFEPNTQQAAIVNREVFVPGVGKTKIKVRLNTMPAYPGGYNVVMRLLIMGGGSGSKATLEDLGYAFEHIESIKEAISKPVGCTIVAGTTGSGKSTSLSVMLTRIVNENMDAAGESCTIKIITVEDPPEYETPHVVQSPVVRSKTKNGENPFAESIRAALRADPDILLVGEVRDEYSAKLLVDIVQSGHMAFTTVHAPSALGIISRLRSIGVPNDVLGNGEFVSGLIYQALVPVSCKYCKIPLASYKEKVESGDLKVADKLSHDQLMKRLTTLGTEKETENIHFKSNEGCEHCKYTGISGRTVVAEVIVPDKFMISCFFNGKDSEALEHYIANGGLLSLDHGVEKMLLGISDPKLIEHKLGRVDNSQRARKNKNKQINKKQKKQKDNSDLEINISSFDKNNINQNSLETENKIEDCDFKSETFKENNNNEGEVISLTENNE